VGLEHVAVGRGIAQREVVQPDGALRGVDRAVVHLVAARDFRRREELPVVESAYAPQPFPVRLRAQAEAAMVTER